MDGGSEPFNGGKDGKTSTNTNSKSSQQDVHKVETRIEIGELSDTPELAMKGDMKPLDKVNNVENARFSNSNASNGAKNVDLKDDTNIKRFENSASKNDAAEKNVGNNGDPIENLIRKEAPKQAEAVISSSSTPTNAKTKIDTNANKDYHLKKAALTKVEESLSTATVFIAAPLAKNHYLAITGEDQILGEWKHPQGNFVPILQINKDLYIFKGIVPIPSRINSKFKFVGVNQTDQKIEYEGDGSFDNRSEELLPDSWNFFVFKPKKAKSMIGKFWEGLAKYIYKPETKESIAEEFFNIVFNHTLENVIPGNKFVALLINFIIIYMHRKFLH